MGFNGVPVGEVGLSTPVSRDPRPGFEWRVGKLGTRSRYEISERIFDHYVLEGRVTRLQVPLWVDSEKALPEEDSDLVVGFAKEKLLKNLQNIGSQSSEGLLRFNWQPNPDGLTGRLHTARLKQAEGTEETEEVTRNLFLLGKGYWYWLGKDPEDLNMLFYWSSGLCRKFDNHWIKIEDELLEASKNRKARKRILRPWEDLLWQAIACGYTNDTRLLESHYRLFVCIAEYEKPEEIRRCFEEGARLVIPDIPWESFYTELLAVREKLNSSK